MICASPPLPRAKTVTLGPSLSQTPTGSRVNLSESPNRVWGVVGLSYNLLLLDFGSSASRTTRKEVDYMAEAIIVAVGAELIAGAVFLWLKGKARKVYNR